MTTTWTISTLERETSNGFVTTAHWQATAVDGRLESRKYTDKDGNSREIVEIVADHVNALDRPREDAEPRQEPRGKSKPAPDAYNPFEDED